MPQELLDRPRRAPAPAHFLRPDASPPELDIEQRAQVLRWLQLADADPLTRRHAVGIDTDSTLNAVRDTAERYRREHGDRAEAGLGDEILAAIERLAPGQQLAFWSSVRLALADQTDSDCTAAATALHLLAGLGEAAAGFVRTKWAEVIRTQVAAGRGQPATF